MKILRTVLGMGCLALPIAAQDEGALLEKDEVLPAAEKVEPLPMSPMEVEMASRVESESGQFGVSGGDAAVRGSVALQAESVRASFLKLLGAEATEKPLPIEILLYGKAGDPPKARPLAYELRFTPDHFLLRIHVDLSRGLDHDRLDSAVLSGLLFDRALAGVKPGALDSPLRAPSWLLVGLEEAQEWADGRGDRRLYEGVFKQKGRFEIDALLSMTNDQHERLDGVSKSIFRVQSGALVMALLGQSGGKAAFVEMCDEAARYGGEFPMLLRRHFPELNLSEKSLVKWWSLTLAKLSEAPLSEAMGIAETEKRLEEALVLQYFTDEGVRHQVPILDWKSLPTLGDAARMEVVRPVQDSLSHLSYRCFPSYRPLILDYQRWLVSWASGEKEPQPLLMEMEETREIMTQRALRARDYLDFVEIHDAHELSGSFDDFMELKREIDRNVRVPRKDRITRYLDAMQRATGSEVRASAP
ncbi:hypothetical protein HNR46_000783 [Haloferula luteola]|uniref:Uncharacterized protein n=1 Tax=Haloferula luteola TaxID=595692 RepID=A0A840UXU9_9BACT|nr:hypothetical protein [Haloferula luteola]MBB5350555.1 hypothetical protein [Haloferula luteola]